MTSSQTTTVIGICGKKFNGKDTIADHMVQHYGFIKISLGDPLKKAIKEIFSFTDVQLWGSDKDVVDPFWKITPREVMQFVGTDCFRIGLSERFPNISDNLWAMVLEKQIYNHISHGHNKIIVPDLRFPNEEQVIRKFNGKIWRVIRENFVNIDEHISENSSNKICTDHEFHNVTIQQLHKDVSVIYETM